MITIQRESYDQVIGEIKPLLKSHWEEVAIHRDEISFDPDYESYQRRERSGHQIIITVRCDGRLVGYAIFFVIYHMHYRTTKFALNDIIYLDPKSRGDYDFGDAAISLIKFSEDEGRKVGARKLVFHVKYCNEFAELLSRLGYGEDERTMGKLL